MENKRGRISSMLKDKSILIVDDLQNALDNRDTKKIQKIMPFIFSDFDSRYTDVLIEYNLGEYQIGAVELINLHYLYPKLKFHYLFVFEENIIKALACGALAALS